MTPTVRVCDKCGWIFPMTYKDHTCRFCKTKFRFNFCDICGDYEELAPNRRICKTCRSQERMYSTTKEDTKKKNDNRALKKRRIQDAAKDEWLSLIKAEGTFEMLTEKQWLEACIHFKGCSLCNSAAIDARCFYIPYRMGGRYAAWNVVPVCEECVTKLRRVKDPFIAGLDTTRITDYLRGRFTSVKSRST